MELWKRNLFVCWIGMFFSSIGMSQIAPILPLYIKQLGVTDVSLIQQYSGIIFGCTFVVAAFFRQFEGKLLINMEENQCFYVQVLGWE